jgi:hypothetical protein
VERLRRKGDESDNPNEPPMGSPPPTPWGSGKHEEEDEAGPVLAVEIESDPYAALVDTYSETPASRRRPEDFYYYADSAVREDVLRVVLHEGPVHEDLIILRVARMYKLQRVGSTIGHTLRNAISSMTRSGRMVRKGKFLWPSGSLKPQVRRASNGNGSRPIQYVPPEELEEAAILVLRLTRGVSQDELIPEIARVLGYARTGDKVERAALEATKRLIKNGRVIERAGFLMPALDSQS